jgi:hypothetical protein
VNGVTNGALFLNQLGLTDVRVKGNSAIPASQFLGFTSAYDARIIQLGAKFNF